MNSIIDDLEQVAPIGPIKEMTAEQAANYGLPDPVQSEPLGVVSLQIPVVLHPSAENYMNDRFGDPYPIKERGEDTGRMTRQGEGKFVKNLMDAHNRRARKHLRKVTFDNKCAYIYIYNHRDCPLITVQLIGVGINGMYITRADLITETLTDIEESLKEAMSNKKTPAEEIVYLS